MTESEKIAYDCDENELRIGDKVRANCDMHYFASEGMIEEFEVFEIDYINGDMLGFTTVSDQQQFPADCFTKVTDKTEKELLDEDITYEQKKIKELYNEIQRRRKQIWDNTQKLGVIDEAPIPFHVDSLGKIHSGASLEFLDDHYVSLIVSKFNTPDVSKAISMLLDELNKDEVDSETIGVISDLFRNEFSNRDDKLGIWKDVEKLVEYNFRDEQKHYLECKDDVDSRKTHIFRTIARITSYLKKVRGA